MTKRIFYSTVLAAAAATFLVVGCGGSSTNGNGPSNGDSGATTPPAGDGGGSGGGDGGGVTPPGKDGGGAAPDDGGNGGNPPLPDGSVLPHGNQLAAGAGIFLDGVTSDDYVVYTDPSNNVFAISLAAGSKAIALGTTDMNNDVTVMGAAVFITTAVDPSSGAGSISVWTSKASAPAALTTTGLVGTYAASKDGSFVAFLDGVDSSGVTATISVAASDATGKTALVPGVDLADDICFPIISFGGSTLVATYCEVGDAGAVDAGAADGGVNVDVGVVTSFSGASWTPATLATAVQTVFSLNSAGTEVVVIGASGSALVPIGGGTAVPIDPNAQIGATTLNPGIQTNDGTGVIYTTTAQALERASTTPPANPVQLGGTQKFSDVFGLSPDQSWLVGMLNQDPNSGGSDLYLASATAAGNATTLSATTTGSVGGGSDLFTADSTSVLFLTNLQQAGGTLNALKVSGGTPVTLGQSAAFVLATSGGKIVFNSNYDGNSNSADLQGVDTAATASPTVLVTAADPFFFLNAEKNTVVYTWSYQSGASAGLWTLPAP